MSGKASPSHSTSIDGAPTRCQTLCWVLEPTVHRTDPISGSFAAVVRTDNTVGVPGKIAKHCARSAHHLTWQDTHGEKGSPKRWKLLEQRLRGSDVQGRSQRDKRSDAAGGLSLSLPFPHHFPGKPCLLEYRSPGLSSPEECP